MQGSQPEADPPSRLRLALVAAAALLLLPGLGGIGLWAPDEPRYAQVAEEIRSFEHGWPGLVVLHLNGRAYDQKPPLYYWSAAALGAPFGHVSERAARLPSALAGIACVAVLLRFGRELVGSRAAWLGGALLLTSQEFANLARRVQLDVMLTLFFSLAMWAIWRLDRDDGRRGANQVLLHGSLGLAALTKGPVGWLPLLVAVVFLAWERRPRDLRRLLPAWAPLLSVAPLLLWFGATLLLNPEGYVQGALVDNLFGRFVHGTSHGRPFYYFLFNFPVLFLPWALFWPLVVPTARDALGPGGDDARRRALRFLLAWVGALFVFFSLSSGKRGLYLLPAAPAAALLTADALLRALRERATLPRWIIWPAGALAALCGVAGLALLAAGPMLPLPLPRTLGAALLGGLCLLGGAWRVAGDTEARRDWTLPLGGAPAARLCVLVAAVLGLELAAFLWIFPVLDAEKSPRAIALAAAERVPPGEHIGLVGERGLIGGIAYYAERRVAPLESSEDVQGFLARGGRVLILRERDLARVVDVAPVAVQARARSGLRALVVVVASPGP